MPLIDPLNPATALVALTAILVAAIVVVPVLWWLEERS